MAARYWLRGKHRITPKRLSKWYCQGCKRVHTEHTWIGYVGKQADKYCDRSAARMKLIKA